MTRFFLPLLAALALSAAAHGGDRPKLEVGAPCPVLELPDLDGAVRSTAEFRGRRTVLHVFASW